MHYDKTRFQNVFVTLLRTWLRRHKRYDFNAANVDVTANEIVRYKRNELEYTFNVRKTCIKGTLNAWIEHYTFNVFFTIRYTCVFKNVRLTHGMKNMCFTITWKALYLLITTHLLKDLGFICVLKCPA